MGEDKYIDQVDAMEAGQNNTQAGKLTLTKTDMLNVTKALIRTEALAFMRGVGFLFEIDRGV